MVISKQATISVLHAPPTALRAPHRLSALPAMLVSLFRPVVVRPRHLCAVSPTVLCAAAPMDRRACSATRAIIWTPHKLAGIIVCNRRMRQMRATIKTLRAVPARLASALHAVRAGRNPRDKTSNAHRPITIRLLKTLPLLLVSLAASSLASSLVWSCSCCAFCTAAAEAASVAC